MFLPYQRFSIILYNKFTEAAFGEEVFPSFSFRPRAVWSCSPPVPPGGSGTTPSLS